jgi:hypothetical protein
MLAMIGGPPIAAGSYITATEAANTSRSKYTERLVPGVAAVAGVQVARTRFIGNGRDIDQLELIRLQQPVPQLIAEASEARLLVGARPLHFAL